MARKSKRGQNTIKHEEAIKPIVFSAAVYLRVSVKDENESNSILNQKFMIENFISAVTDITIHKFFIDNGISSFEKKRPAFSEMISDIKSGIVNCVIVKDLSRFGRDYIEVDSYLETIFPFMNVRFISILDDFDSNNEIIPIQTFAKILLNNYYSHDLSKKVKSVIRQKQENGKYRAARLPFGYMKNNNYDIVIDDEAANIVRSVFKCRKFGMSYQAIANYLNENDCLSPLDYKNDTNNHNWTAKAVERIIKNRFYLGEFIAGKTENMLGSMQKIKAVPKEEWIVIPNNHAPIINNDIFEQCQTNLTIARTTKKKPSENILLDKLYCSRCGRKMRRRVWNGRNYYVCPKAEEDRNLCVYKSFREDRLIEDINNLINTEIIRINSIILNKTEGEETKLTIQRITELQDELGGCLDGKNVIYDKFLEEKYHSRAHFNEVFDPINKEIENLTFEIEQLNNFLLDFTEYKNEWYYKILKMKVRVSIDGINQKIEKILLGDSIMLS